MRSVLPGRKLCLNTDELFLLQQLSLSLQERVLRLDSEAQQQIADNLYIRVCVCMYTIMGFI